MNSSKVANYSSCYFLNNRNTQQESSTHMTCKESAAEFKNRNLTDGNKTKIQLDWRVKANLLRLAYASRDQTMIRAQELINA
jgi:hypothetical protein